MKQKSRWVLVFYDILIFLLSSVVILLVYPSNIMDLLTLEMDGVYAFAVYFCFDSF